jgi:hypothetical protein
MRMEYAMRIVGIFGFIAFLILMLIVGFTIGGLIMLGGVII